MGKWMIRRVGKAKSNPRSSSNKRPSGTPRRSRQIKRTKRKQRAVQVNKSTSSKKTPSRVTFQEQSLYGSFPGHGNGPDLTTSFTGFNPAYNTRTTCDKCNILAQEMKNRPRSYEELFHMAVNNMMRNSANDHEVQTQDSRVARKVVNQGSGNKCNTCQALGSNDSFDTYNIHGYSHFPGSFSRSTLRGVEALPSSCAQFRGQSMADSYESLFDRPLQSTYCRMCLERGIYNCQVA